LNPGNLDTACGAASGPIDGDFGVSMKGMSCPSLGVDSRDSENGNRLCGWVNEGSCRMFSGTDDWRNFEARLAPPVCHQR
jgi:hypothetical protein